MINLIISFYEYSLISVMVTKYLNLNFMIKKANKSKGPNLSLGKDRNAPDPINSLKPQDSPFDVLMNKDMKSFSHKVLLNPILST